MFTVMITSMFMFVTCQRVCCLLANGANEQVQKKCNCQASNFERNEVNIHSSCYVRT